MLCALVVGLSAPAFAQVKIGMVIDDLRLERWQRDRDLFVNRAEELGAKVYVQSANGNETDSNCTNRKYDF